EVAVDWLLDLHDQLALPVQRGGVGGDVDAEAGVLLVGEAAAGAGASLQPDLVTALDQVACGGGHERNAPFGGLGVPGDTNAHASLLGGWSWMDDSVAMFAACIEALPPPS